MGMAKGAFGIRGMGSGEIVLARGWYDGIELLAPLERYGGESPQTVH